MKLTKIKCRQRLNPLTHMKKIHLLAMFALLAVAGACDSKNDKGNSAVSAEQNRVDSLELVIDQMRSETNDLNQMKLKITDILRQINEAEGRITNLPEEASEQQIILENMAFIQQKMNEYRKTVGEMRQQLRNAKQISDNAKKGYEADIESYLQTMKEKDAEIASLREQLTQKEQIILEQTEKLTQQTEQVNHLTADNEAKQRAIDEQDQKLHSAWYVYGTKRELEEENILVKGKIMESDKVNHDYFTRIDIRATKSIPLYSKKVKLLTTHPEGTYSFVKDEKGEYVFNIIQPEKFWSTSRYLVISVR